MLSNDLKLLAVFDNLEKRIDKVSTIVGETGQQGPKGEQGKAGSDGKQGPKGEKGQDGVDGADGVSVVSLTVDFDNHLVVELSDGTSLDAGEIRVEEGKGTYNVSMGGAISAPLPAVTLVTSNSYTTLQDPLEEVIKCTSSIPQTITLHPTPRQGQRKIIKRLGTGAVTVIGTVDGEPSTELGVDVSVQLIYIDDSWIII